MTVLEYGGRIVVVDAVELIEKILHDDLAEFLYKRLRRRPMILPVVVEV